MRRSSHDDASAPNQYHLRSLGCNRPPRAVASMVFGAASGARSQRLSRRKATRSRCEAFGRRTTAERSRATGRATLRICGRPTAESERIERGDVRRPAIRAMRSGSPHRTRFPARSREPRASDVRARDRKRPHRRAPAADEGFRTSAGDLLAQAAGNRCSSARAGTICLGIARHRHRDGHRNERSGVACFSTLR